MNFWEEDADESAEVLEEGLMSEIGIGWEFLNHDILKIFVTAKGMQTPVLGTAFHLDFDGEALAFLRYDPGEFLERGGDPFYLVHSKKDHLGFELGELIFGETLRREDDFPVGDGVVVNFYFQEVSPDDEMTYKFEFDKGVVSTLDTVRQDLDHVSFVDGEFSRGMIFEEIGVDAAGSDAGKFGASVLEAVPSGSYSYVWFVLGIALLFGGSGFYLIKSRFWEKFDLFKKRD